MRCPIYHFLSVPFLMKQMHFPTLFLLAGSNGTRGNQPFLLFTSWVRSGGSYTLVFSGTSKRRLPATSNFLAFDTAFRFMAVSFKLIWELMDRRPHFTKSVGRPDLFPKVFTLALS